MSDMSLFFANAVTATEDVECSVSERFKDKDGKAIPWKLRPISEEKNDEIRKSTTHRVKGKGGVYTQETNSSEYTAKLVTACVVYPNLKDAALQESYGVRGAEPLVRKMLLSGEYINLLAKIQEINGFDNDVNELAEDVKNE